MGAVYLARDLLLGRLVALKLLVYDDPELVARLVTEARSTARCHHDNIVVIHEVSEHQGMPYLVLEYLEGETLAALLRRSPVAPHVACELMVPVLRALAHAHSKGIVHRDLKPENIFVTKLGTVKVLDFGIAKAAGTAERASLVGVKELKDPKTELGHLVGTLPYMAPEQLRGLPVDGRADVWAVGIILHELVTGCHPLGHFDRLDALRLTRTTDQMPDAAALEENLPARFATLLAGCWRERSERHASAKALCLEIEDFIGTRGAALGVGECPYPGLGTFERSHAGLFFGRGADVRRVHARLRQSSVVAISGPSGIGKSSLLYAGVLPALEASGEGWEIHTLRPGRAPVSALTSLLRNTGIDESELGRIVRQPGYLGAALRERYRNTGDKILVVVDQFEELFTLASEDERGAFVSILRGIADDESGPLRVMLSIRSDYVHKALEQGDWGRSLVDGLVFLSPLGGEALREALVEPCRATGYSFEDDALVDRVIGDIEECGGALPLLQFAASKLWDARDTKRRVLTNSSYEGLGGLGGALSSYADDVILSLGPTGESMARRALVSLVTSEGTRSVESPDDLCRRSSRPEEMREVLRKLVNARLLVSRGEGETRQIELVHEALIEQWPRLRMWFDEQRHDLVFRRQLSSAVAQWDARSRPDGLVWRGEALADAERWLATTPVDLSENERAFLKRARGQRDATLRRMRRTRFVGGAFLGVLVIVGFTTLLAYNASERSARESAEDARDQLERALSAELRATSAARRAEQEAEQRLQAQQRALEVGEVVRQQDEDLREVNSRLASALSEREREAERAQLARREAEAEAERAQSAERDSRVLLQREAERARRLEERLRNISTELR